MKHSRIFLIAVITLLVVLAPREIKAQAASDTNAVVIKQLANGGMVINIQQKVTSTNTQTSPAFCLDGYLENTYSYPVGVSYSIDTANVAAGVDVDSLAVFLKATNNPDLKNATFAFADTLSATLGTTAYTLSSLDLNNKKAAWWQVVSIGKGSNTGAWLKMQIYLCRKDH